MYDDIYSYDHPTNLPLNLTEMWISPGIGFEYTGIEVKQL